MTLLGRIISLLCADRSAICPDHGMHSAHRKPARPPRSSCYEKVRCVTFLLSFTSFWNGNSNFRVADENSAAKKAKCVFAFFVCKRVTSGVWEAGFIDHTLGLRLCFCLLLSFLKSSFTVGSVQRSTAQASSHLDLPFQVLVATYVSCTPAVQPASFSTAELRTALGARSALCCIIKFSPEWELRNSPLKTWTLWVRGQGSGVRGHSCSDCMKVVWKKCADQICSSAQMNNREFTSRIFRDKGFFNFFFGGFKLNKLSWKRSDPPTPPPW